MTAIDFHWLIGYLEGEGAFSNKRRLVIEVNATDYAPLKRGRSLLGGRLCARKPPKKKGIGKKKMFRWTAGRSLVMNFLICAVRQFSPRRQKQIFGMIKEHRRRKIYTPWRKELCG